jgi:CRP-like cAMP-binding protein
VWTERFLRNRRGVELTLEERQALENAISETRRLEARKTVIEAGQEVDVSTILLDGLMSRYIDDRRGMRQLVAVHVAGEFVDLHAYPMKRLDHSVGTLTPATIGIVPHRSLKALLDPRPELARKLWFATLIDAAMHRTWLFRLGRLDAAGRVAHFICETNERLKAVGLSDGRQFSLDLTQTDLAEVCGLTTVHINRVIRQLREANLCIFRSSMVEILDGPGLARRGDFDPSYLYLTTT